MPRVATVVLTSTTGKAWKKRDFADQWKEAGDLAGLTDLHFHDLRGMAVTMLAEAGSTIPEIAAITDHSLKTVNTILEKYLSRTRALAESAMETIENARQQILQTAVNPKPPKPAKRLKIMARPKGFEPLTLRFVV